ncbi:TonB-dependent receptor [Mangrovimonas cancribranchiae]|uniref:TonB-dependent receptor n=1 Tax=Mangrovimonas cancribranchiae TaxID=3080055 RepID=A0AAU6P4C0_9FLAO
MKYLSVVLFTLTGMLSWSQERDNDTIGTNVINVVKPYTPSISDAFKVKETPSLDDEVTTTKKEVKYNIFSFPVASTFTPAKGKAATVEKEKPAKLYDNYATLGFGSYTTILGEVYLNHAISRTDNVGGYVSHHSSQGGIEDVLLDDHFYDSKINVNYSRTLRDLSWNIEGGFLHQVYNWYGLPQPYFTTESPEANMDVNHTFYGANIGGDIQFEDTYLKNIDVLFRHFGDDYSSAENRFKATATADIPIVDEEITTTLVLDYLGGSFDRNYYTNEELKYGNFNIGLKPTYRIIYDDLTLDLGVSTFYLNDIENSDNKFYIYPNISASYKVVNEVLIAYGGIKGDLIQNSYYDFAQDNPFVSPTLFIAPTDQQYNAYVGLKGKVSNSVSYNIKGAYLAERDKALFKNNELVVNGAEEVYQHANSYGVVYDDVSTFNIGGQLSVDINRNFTLGIKADYFAYDVDNQEVAWNLPEITGSLFMDYQINKHWFAGANIYYVGERKAQMDYTNSLVPVNIETIALDSYFDANAHAGYHVNDKLSVYAKVNNIANQNYNRWLNYPVQSFQALAGATYKFDF